MIGHYELVVEVVAKKLSFDAVDFFFIRTRKFWIEAGCS